MLRGLRVVNKVAIASKSRSTVVALKPNHGMIQKRAFGDPMKDRESAFENK